MVYCVQVFPTKQQTWVSLEEKPMIADHKEWEKWFGRKPGVHFLDTEDRLRATKKDFMHFPPSFRGRWQKPGRGRDERG